MFRRLPAWVPWGRGALPLILGLFLMMRVGEATGLAPRWARGYLDDLLCLPLVLATVLAVHRLVTRDSQWRLPMSHGLLALVLYGAYFEAILPRLSVSAVADPFDLVMYAAGLALFQIMINRPGCVSERTDRSSNQENDRWPHAAHL